MTDQNTPYTIDFIHKIIEECDQDDHIISYRLQRSDEMNIEYLKHSVKCKETYGTLEHYVTCVILKDFTVDYVITDNNFPYYIEKGLKHKLLWTNKKMIKSEIEEIIRNKISSRFVWFENLAINKSIPNIHHYHIIFDTNIAKDKEKITHNK